MADDRVREVRTELDGWVSDRMFREHGKLVMSVQWFVDGWTWNVSEQSARFAGARTVLHEGRCDTLAEAVHQANAYAEERSRPSQVRGDDQGR